MWKTRLIVALSVVSMFACGGGAGGIDPVTGEGVEEARQALIVDDVYARLREAENLLSQPVPQSTVTVGTVNPTTGTYSGLSTIWTINPITHKPSSITPVTSITGIEAVLQFNAAQATWLTLTAAGKTVTVFGTSVSLNVGTARNVPWTLTAGGYNFADTLIISRPYAAGTGAFTVSAMPISIVYEPPMNAARTNWASIAFRQEMTTITTVSKSTSSTAKPKWATGVVLSSILDRLARSNNIAALAKNAIGSAKVLMGSVDTSTTTGTTVNTDNTLGLTQVSASSITTNARLGPGRGDVIVFYKNARVAWAMEEGEVTLVLLDHGPLGMVTVDTLRNELAIARAGQVPPVTGLDATTLESLIALDPLASTTTSHAPGGFPDAPVLVTPRFRKDTTLILNGTSFNNLLSHTVTQTDKTSTTNTTTTVRDYHPGWLSLIGIGETRAGTYTTSVSLGTSRTDSVSSTISAQFNLSAAANESYSVDVHYDNIFGSFLTRNPPLPPIVIGFN